MHLNVLHLNMEGQHNHQILATNNEYFVDSTLHSYLSDIHRMLETRRCQSLACQFQDMVVSGSINSDAHKN